MCETLKALQCDSFTLLKKNALRLREVRKALHLTTDTKQAAISNRSVSKYRFYPLF